MNTRVCAVTGSVGALWAIGCGVLASSCAAAGPGLALPEPLAASLPMRDGASLAADVYLPGTPGRFPAILVMTPYDRLHFRRSRQTVHATIFDHEHYACVTVDWRGFHGSKAARATGLGGPMKTLGRDGHDCVEWIVRQPWSDGRVGMWGPSALGRVQFQTAAEHPPHLVCIVPVVASFGHSYEQYYCGGVLRTGYLDGLSIAGFRPAERLIRRHPSRDLAWKLIESASDPSSIDVPTFLIGGWYDLFTDRVIATFRGIRARGGPAARAHSRLLVGPWHHTAMGHATVGELEFPEAEGASQREAMRFLDRWLRGRDDGREAEPAVRYFRMGSNEWRSAESWPPGPAREVTLHLDRGGALAATAPAGDGQDEFRYDPLDPSPTVGGMNLSLYEMTAAAPLVAALKGYDFRAGPMDQAPLVERRSDARTYTTPPLRRPMPVCGSVRVELFVSTDCPDTDVAVRLCDVFPDGRSMLVGDGIQRLRYAGGDRLVDAGETRKAVVTMQVTALTFLAGHRLRIVVTSSNYPRYDRNPNNGRQRLEDGGEARVAANRVHYGPAHPSRAVLPVVPDEDPDAPGGR